VVIFMPYEFIPEGISAGIYWIEALYAKSRSAHDRERGEK